MFVKKHNMTKTLIVSYTPRIGSYTKVLLDEFLSLSKGKTEINHLDLVESPPDLLLADNLNLMMEWNSGKREFTESERVVLSNHQDVLTKLLDADHIVLAFPIYNFSLPATVKSWVDAIVVSGKTFSFDPEKGFYGLCDNKKALVLMVSGFDYSNSSSVKEYASSTIKANLDFIGIPSLQVSAFGVDENRDKIDSILNLAKEKINGVIKAWY